MTKEKKERKHRLKKLFREFKEFISKGNIVDLAIAFMLGAAFKAIVNSLVGDIISPLISAIFKVDDLSSLVINVNGGVIKYGSFVKAVIDFLIMALVLFIILKITIKVKEIANYNKIMANQIQTKFDNNEDLTQKDLQWLKRANKKGYKNIPSKKEKVEPEKTDNEKIIELLAAINEKLDKNQNENISLNDIAKKPKKQ